jgi:hypothetical protein
MGTLVNGATQDLPILPLDYTKSIDMVPMALLVATKKRPPTLSGLIWGAALTFAMIGLRGLFPGMPPLGILLDKVVYFPSLLITLICSLSILIMWCYREDYVN